MCRSPASSALLVLFAGYVSLWSTDLLHQLFDRSFELTIATREIVFRQIVHANVRLHAIVLHVRAFRIREVNADARRAHRRAIDQRITARANYGAHRRRADGLTQSQRFESGREHLGVGSRAPGLPHDLRPEVTRERTPAGFDATWLPDFVFALHEDREQLLFDVTAAVPALIDDHRFLVAELANLFLELSQGRLIHRADVQIADAAIRHLIYFLPAFFYPTIVTQR